MAKVLVVAMIALIVVVTGCGDGKADGSPTPSNVGEVRGRLVSVDAVGLLSLNSLRLWDKDGKEWEFDAREYRGLQFTPSHLREHMTQGTNITVTYRKDGESLVVVEIRD